MKIAKIIIKDHPSELIAMRINKNSMTDGIEITTYPNQGSLVIMTSLNLLIQLNPQSVLFMDMRNFKILFEQSIEEYFEKPAYFIAGLMNENKFIIYSNTQMCLFQLNNLFFKNLRCVDKLVDLYIHRNLMFLNSNKTSFVVYYGEYPYLEDNLNYFAIFDNNLQELTRQYQCNIKFEIAFSSKFSILVSTIYQNSKLKLNIRSVFKGNDLVTSLISKDNISNIGQIDEEYYYLALTDGTLQFYSFATIELVKEMKHQKSGLTQKYYFEKTIELFILSSSKELYYGFLDIQNDIDQQVYTIQQITTETLEVIENLDIFITFYFTGYQIFQKSTGILLTSFPDQFITSLIVIPGFSMILISEMDYNDFVFFFKMFDLSSFYDESEAIMDRNQSIIPLLYQNENKIIFATSLENHLYKIDIQSQKMILLMKRGSNILKINQTSNDLLLIQCSHEIILFNTKSEEIIKQKSIDKNLIKIFDILVISEYSDEQIISIIAAEKPKKICNIQFDLKGENQDSLKCDNSNESISDILILNTKMLIINHKNGDISIRDTQSFVMAFSQKLFEQKYQAIILKQLQKINNSSETHYLFTYSIDKCISLHQINIISDQFNIKIGLEEIYKYEYQTQISKVILSSDHKYIIISLQDNIRIQKLCITCLIQNGVESSFLLVYFLPFIRYYYKVKIFEKINCLLVFTDYIFVVFDYITTYPIFVSSSNYQKNIIYDAILINQQFIALSRADNFEVHKLDLQSFHLKQDGGYLHFYIHHLVNILQYLVLIYQRYQRITEMDQKNKQLFIQLDIAKQAMIQYSLRYLYLKKEFSISVLNLLLILILQNSKIKQAF